MRSDALASTVHYNEHLGEDFNGEDDTITPFHSS